MMEDNNKGVNPLYNSQKKLKNPRLLEGRKSLPQWIPDKRARE